MIVLQYIYAFVLFGGIFWGFWRLLKFVISRLGAARNLLKHRDMM